MRTLAFLSVLLLSGCSFFSEGESFVCEVEVSAEAAEGLVVTVNGEAISAQESKEVENPGF